MCLLFTPLRTCWWFPLTYALLECGSKVLVCTLLLETMKLNTNQYILPWTYSNFVCFRSNAQTNLAVKKKNNCRLLTKAVSPFTEKVARSAPKVLVVKPWICFNECKHVYRFFCSDPLGVDKGEQHGKYEMSKCTGVVCGSSKVLRKTWLKKRCI